MAIVIAILLALILVAMMTSNKAASEGVFHAVRIAFITGLIILTWLIFIVYSSLYYSEYSSQSWYDLIGVAVVCLAPPVAMWIGRDDLKAFFKQEDQKKVFKVLLLWLLAAIVISVVGLTYQEYKKTNPYLGQQILWVGLAITGFILYRRSLKYPRGWRDVLSPPVDDPDDAYSDFFKRNREENERFDPIEAALDVSNGSEVVRLRNEHLRILQVSQEILDKRLETIASSRNPETDYVLQAFIYICVFIGIGWAIDLWWFAYDLALTLDFVKGRPLWAGGFVIALVLGVIAVVNDLIERYRK